MHLTKGGLKNIHQATWLQDAVNLAPEVALVSHVMDQVGDENEISDRV
jgi:hypothetical protein